ncbi:hypothetical protein L1887_39729 [Cichorium endivia]|nr:hypothetical protein L1887_39729 [Cichorium endivia]
MLSVLTVIKRNMKKSTKVADESMFRDGNGIEIPVIAHPTRQGWNGLSFIYNIVVRAPLSLLSCLSSHPHGGGVDGVWVSGEFSRISEINHLMVNDSMRYAILM